MSRIDGHGGYVIEDSHIANAHQKLMCYPLEITSDDHWIAASGENGSVAKFTVDGETDTCRRWSWRVFNGPIPEGHRIYLSCGVEDCVNPLHEYAYQAGPPAPSDRDLPPNAKLTWESVAEIRAMENPDIGILAAKYSVGRATIWNVIRGKTWIRK